MKTSYAEDSKFSNQVENLFLGFILALEQGSTKITAVTRCNS